MKRNELLVSTLAGAVWMTALLAGCASGNASSSSSSGSGGIDPVTMAGIEASNRATDEEIQRVNTDANAAAAAAAANQ